MDSTALAYELAKRRRMTGCGAMQNAKLYSADTTVCLIPQADGNLVTSMPMFYRLCVWPFPEQCL